jgi:hypothetical protein
MSIRCRPMRHDDLAPCVDIVAQHPYAGCRYADVVCELRAVWSSLLGHEAFRAYDAIGTVQRHVGVGWL